MIARWRRRRREAREWRAMGEWRAMLAALAHPVEVHRG